MLTLSARPQTNSIANEAQNQRDNPKPMVAKPNRVTAPGSAQNNRMTKSARQHHGLQQARAAVSICWPKLDTAIRSGIAVHIVIGAQKFMRKSGGHFVFLPSARGLR
jgi:hypothetical protein